MDQELKQYLDARFGEADRRAKEVESRLEARLKDMENNLRSLFYGWSRPMEIRADTITNRSMGFDERLSLAERRISSLERKRAS